MTRARIRLIKTILPLWFLLALSLWVETTLAEQAPDRKLVIAVDAIGMTVADMDRSVDFYSKVLSFEKVADVKVIQNGSVRLINCF